MTQTRDGQDAVLKTFDKEQIVGYNNGIQTNEVDAMAKERDYAKEWEREKEKRRETEARASVKLTPTEAADFAAKCAANGTTKNAVLKNYIKRYTYENFDQ